jgi:RNA polymerase sigma factor (sigma-70 family)
MSKNAAHLQHDEHVRVFRQEDCRDISLPRKCPLIFYERPFLCIFVFWLMAGMDAPLKDFLHIVAAPPTATERPTASQTRLTSHYWHHRDKHNRRKGDARIPGLRELLSKEAIERGKHLKKSRRPGLLSPQEELDLARLGKAGNNRARDEIIARHWHLVERKCRHVKMADQADAIAVGTARLLKAWDDWDQERGVRFGAFAAQAVEWAIQDFMDQCRRQVPVAQSINANNPVADNMDTQRAENMMTNSNNEKRAIRAKRNLVAERAVECLDPLHQRVIESRLGLNGYQPLEQEQIADQLGMSVRHIRRIEKAAIRKLQEAVA